MPKLKQTPGEILVENIEKLRKERNLAKSDLYDVFGKSHNTYDDRMDDPGSISVNEIIRLMHKFCQRR